MTSEEFVKLVREESRDFAIEWESGSPPDRDKKISTWLLSLPANEREYIQIMIASAVDNSIFKIMEILDGLHTEQKLQVRVEKNHNGEWQNVSGPGCKQLHDLFADELYKRSK